MNARGVVIGSLVAAVIGLALLAVGFVVDDSRACFAYLQVWTFGTTICMGALLLLMVGHAAKASWMVVTRRLTEALVDAMPIYLVLFVPIALSLRLLYPWAAPDRVVDATVRAAILHKRAYLNQPFFVVRGVVYLLVFIVIGTLLRRWSRANDDRPSLVLVHRMRGLSGGALPLVGLTLTWASFDWTMSLQPSWSSTIFGMYFFAGSFVGAIAVVCVMLHASRPRRAESPVTGDHAQALGRVLFAMVIFWAYMAFSQLLIYWIGNIPEEVTFYRARTTGSWTAITYVLVLGNFVAPFFALLNRHLKRDTAYLAVVGAWVLLMHFVDTYWMVMPVHDPAGVRPHWVDAGAILFFGGVSCAWVVRRYFTASPLPQHVPELVEGIHYEAAV